MQPVNRVTSRLRWGASTLFFVMAVLGASFLAACGDVSDTGNDLVSGEPDEDNIYLGDDTDPEDRFATTTLALTSVGTGFYYPIDVTIAGDENWLYCGKAPG